MVYALNVYDPIPGKEAVYREYLQRSQALNAIHGVKVSIVVAGRNPLRHMRGEQRQKFAIVQFDSEADFNKMYELLQQEDLHRLRDESTTNYLWTLYEPWEFRRKD